MEQIRVWKKRLIRLKVIKVKEIKRNQQNKEYSHQNKVKNSSYSFKEFLKIINQSINPELFSNHIQILKIRFSKRGSTLVS